MANEIILDDPSLIGSTVYANLRQGVEKYSDAANDYAPVDPDDPEDRAIPLTDPDDSGMFRADLPPGLSMSESHIVKIFLQLGATPQDTDPEVGAGSIGGSAGGGGGGEGGDIEIEDGIFMSDVLSYLFAPLAGIVSGAGTGEIVVRAGGQGQLGPVRIVAQTDKHGNRTNIQLFPRQP